MFKWPIVSLCAVLSFACLMLFRDAVSTFVAVALLGIIMLIASWSWEHLIVYITLFIFGIVIEILSVREGVWSYATQNIFGVPIWIPFIWSNSGLFVIELKEIVDDYLRRRP